MSNENVDAVRRSFEAWNKNEWATLEELYHPGAVAVAPAGWLEMGPFNGFEEVRAQFARIKDSWDEEHVEIDSLRDVGPDKVLALIRWVAKGRGSGIAFETPMTELLTVRGGTIARVEFYLDHGEALKAAGLSE
ncbi:MAG: nuclear transport factor 2 family protein [Solirubrobacterales bacterium]